MNFDSQKLVSFGLCHESDRETKPGQIISLLLCGLSIASVPYSYAIETRVFRHGTPCPKLPPFRQFRRALESIFGIAPCRKRMRSSLGQRVHHAIHHVQHTSNWSMSASNMLWSYRNCDYSQLTFQQQALLLFACRSIEFSFNETSA